MSPVVFNNVTRLIFEDLKAKWASEGLGIIVCQDENACVNTTHCMFADDTTLFASDRRSLVQMLDDMRLALAKHGLKLNLKKCMIQTNRQTDPSEPICIEGQDAKVVDATVGFRVLGAQYTLLGRCGAEIRAREAVAWVKFFSLKDLSCKRDGNLTRSLRLFDSTLTMSALWCCESWLVTQKETNIQNDSK